MAIPKLVAWKVTTIYNDGRRGCTIVDAVNKRFAKWNAEKSFGSFYWMSPHIEKITVSRWKDAS